MPVRLTDQDIARLIREPKLLPADFRARIETRPKRGHKERELDLRGADGSDFRLILRQSLYNALDFSVILAFCPAESNQIFRLRRYNGKHGEHSNTIEGHTFYDFHIHEATERYQELGGREDAFARPTDRFADLQGAFRCLIEDGALQVPPQQQIPLFEEMGP